MKNHNDNIAVKLTNVSKQYTIHHEKPTLVEKFIRNKNEKFQALHNINLSIYKGEKVGLIGPNGCGKTTLLKVITGISSPTTGNVKTSGKVVSLIDLEAGFHPDLTGDQNIYLNGMLLGMTKKQICAKFDEIVRFADIRQFIDTPLFTYSQGMKLRLSFAIAVYAEPDILIIDEGIGVGDENFQKKSQRKIQELFTSGKTILVVTHWLEFVEENCNRIIVLREGSILDDGSTKLVKKYKNLNLL